MLAGESIQLYSTFFFLSLLPWRVRSPQPIFHLHSVLPSASSSVTSTTAMSSLTASINLLFDRHLSDTSHGSTFAKMAAVQRKGAVVAKRVRALDWRPGSPCFESSCGKFVSELLQFHLPRFASVFRRRHYKPSVLSIWCLCQGK